MRMIALKILLVCLLIDAAILWRERPRKGIVKPLSVHQLEGEEILNQIFNPQNETV